MRKTLFSLLIVISLYCWIDIETQTEYPAAIKSITGTEALFHIKFLASEELRGRDTFTQEQLIAGRYIANEFEKYGLESIPRNNSYYQDIKMKYAKVERFNNLEINGKLLKEGIDFQVAAVGKNKLEKEVVFVGYGVSVDEYDSYADIDAKDKIVMVFEGKIYEEGEKWAFAPLHEVRILNAINHGAAGMLFVRGTSPKDHKLPLPSEIALGRLKLTMSFAEKFGLGKWNDEIFKKWSAFPMTYITMDAANQLLAKAGKTVAEFKQEIDKSGKPHSFSLRQKVRMETDVSHSSRYTMNVIGMIKGIDPSLRDEFVVIGAHYDHIGIKAELGEVYYGADDNASGTGALLEIAQAFAQCTRKPKRSILFISFTGEERGLIGSQYYVDNPVVPLSKTVAMFNMDMVGRNDTCSIDIGCLGDENLITFSREASKVVDINIHFNKDNIYVSTDHASFLTKDIPILFYHDGGGDFAHKTIDTWDELLPQNIEKVARLCFLTAYLIADKN
jgi:hypothetical protein